MFCVSFSSKEGIDLNGASRRHHLRHLPPVTPTECIRDTVISIIFDQLWSEVLHYSEEYVQLCLYWLYMYLYTYVDICCYSAVCK